MKNILSQCRIPHALFDYDVSCMTRLRSAYPGRHAAAGENSEESKGTRFSDLGYIKYGRPRRLIFTGEYL